MNKETLEQARAGLLAGQEGNVQALEPLLDPEVELTWWEPGEWDCHGCEAVLALLRERVPAAGMRPATLITFREGKVITMRQFRDRPEALASVAGHAQ